MRWWLLCLPLLLYVVLPTRNFYWDGVAFAIDIEKQPGMAGLLHPNHLIYGIFGSWIYALSGTRALFAMQAANGILAGLCVVLFYRMLEQEEFPEPLRMPAALVFAFSATWWRFATDANAYVPAIFCLFAVSLLLETPIVAGLCHAAAMLFHELAILFLPVALLRLKKDRTQYLAAAILPTAAAYLSAHGVLSPRSSFLSWITYHSPDSGFFFQPLTNAGLSLRGTFRLFLGGKVNDFVAGPVSIMALLGLFAAAVLLGLSVWRGERFVGAKPMAISFWAWLGIYIAFLFVWMPQNTFYRLFYLPPLIALAFRYVPVRPAWLLVAVLFGWNFTFLIYPQSRPEANAPLRFALAQSKRWPLDTPIVFATFHPDLWTISYFNQQASWVTLLSADPSLLDVLLTQHKIVWIEETAYDLLRTTEQGKSWLQAHERPDEGIHFEDPKHDFRFHAAR